MNSSWTNFRPLNYSFYLIYGFFYFRWGKKLKKAPQKAGGKLFSSLFSDLFDNSFIWAFFSSWSDNFFLYIHLELYWLSSRTQFKYYPHVDWSGWCIKDNWTLFYKCVEHLEFPDFIRQIHTRNWNAGVKYFPRLACELFIRRGREAFPLAPSFRNGEKLGEISPFAFSFWSVREKIVQKRFIYRENASGIFYSIEWFMFIVIYIV